MWLILGFEIVDRGCCGTGEVEVSWMCNALSRTCSNISNYFFWDSFHPTEKAYKIIVDNLLQIYVNDVLSLWRSSYHVIIWPWKYWVIRFYYFLFVEIVLYFQTYLIFGSGYMNGLFILVIWVQFWFYASYFSSHGNTWWKRL